VELRHFVFVVALVGSAFAACTRVDVASPSSNAPFNDGGFAGESEGGSGSVAGAGGDGSAGERQVAGGAPGAVELGVWPTFAADPPQSRDAQAVLASVSALSLGATTLPLAERWDSLSGATGSPRTLTWNRLDAMTKPYRDRNGNIALCIGIVDRELPAWPVISELGSDDAAAAMERTVDEVYARYAGQLSHLCFGYELDRYLATATSAEQKTMLGFLKHSIAYASQHPLRSPKTAIGAAITLGALALPDPLPLDDLSLSDEVVAVYDPLDAGGKLKAPEAVADEVALALARLSSQAPALPLALFEVGYPSGAATGSTEKKQKRFYDALFGLLETRRDEISFVGVFGLGDRAAADCDAEATSFGGSSDEKALRALVRCSMGLRADHHKLAWSSVVSAISSYR
jgi:hypothetical protein